MKKKKLKEKSDFFNPGFLIVLVLFILVIVLTFNAYFFKPFKTEKKKYEISSSEQLELVMLTEAFLRTNDDFEISNSLIKDYDINTYGNKFNVAAEYYYYLNHDKLTEEVLVNYDAIMELAKKIYDTNNIAFSNFEINIDDNYCGITKYSSLEGIIYNDSCDQKDLIYEIKDVYREDNKYVVEFYGAKAIQNKIDSTLECQSFEIPLTYQLQISSLDGQEYYDEEYARCCNNDEECILSGIFPLKSEILNQVHINDTVYRMIFTKNNDNFVYYQLRK